MCYSYLMLLAVSGKGLGMEYTYGDEVTVEVIDTEGVIASKAAVVVGITLVASEQQAANLGFPLAITLYTVEFGDGSDALVPTTAIQSRHRQPSNSE